MFTEGVTHHSRVLGCVVCGDRADCQGRQTSPCPHGIPAVVSQNGVLNTDDYCYYVTFIVMEGAREWCSMKIEREVRLFIFSWVLPRTRFA